MGKKGQPQTSKADAKFEKKVKFYTKVRDAVVSLSAKKDIAKKKNHRRKQKLAAYDLTALKDFLPELNAQQSALSGQFKLNGKSRQKLLLKEGRQLSNVLKHPTFVADPLTAIHQHLTSTQPVIEEKPKEKIKKNGSKKLNRKKKSKASPLAMDI